MEVEEMRDVGVSLILYEFLIFYFLRRGVGGKGLRGLELYFFFFDNLIRGGEDLNPRYVCWKHKKLYPFFLFF